MTAKVVLRTYGRWFCLFAALVCGGCPPPLPNQPIASPLQPKQIRLHPFTGTVTFSQGGGISGIEARVEVIDQFGEATKAYGSFRFEMYEYRPHQADPRGRQLACWQDQIADAKTHHEHWDPLFEVYKFRLQWDDPIPVGKKFVLDAVFVGSGGPRLFDRGIYMSGQ